MTEVNELYECAICGNKVKVVARGDGALACCGQEMMSVSE